MKANAPEKIWINQSDLPKLSGHIDKESVKYTRTDAFLKMAEEFFEDHLTEEDCKFGSSEWVEVKTDFGSIDLFLRAFRNYMKEKKV